MNSGLWRTIKTIAFWLAIAVDIVAFRDILARPAISDWLATIPFLSWVSFLQELDTPEELARAFLFTIMGVIALVMFTRELDVIVILLCATFALPLLVPVGHAHWSWLPIESTFIAVEGTLIVYTIFTVAVLVFLLLTGWSLFHPPDLDFDRDIYIVLAGLVLCFMLPLGIFGVSIVMAQWSLAVSLAYTIITAALYVGIWIAVIERRRRQT